MNACMHFSNGINFSPHIAEYDEKKSKTSGFLCVIIMISQVPFKSDT